MERADLLIELLTEELPAKTLTGLAGAFRDIMVDGLKKRGLSADFSDAEALWTPRRLVVMVPGLALEQPAQVLERRGPAIAAALDAQGQPAKALTGFAASCGVTVEQLERLETDKGAWFVHRSHKPGAATADLLAEIINESIKALPVPKPMRWGNGEFAFLRPVHGLLVLLGDALIRAQVFDVTSSRSTRGHRFTHPDLIEIRHPDTYAAQLREAGVMIDPAERARVIREQATAKAIRAGGVPHIRDELLDEVVNLNEWPVPLLCAIPSEFMRLPDAVIISTIESHQKFFPILDHQGKLLPAFIGVANLESRDAQEIRKGYERVTRPRLSDAAFFFDRDLATPLGDAREGLKRVTFQGRLGSLWDKTVRVRELCRWLAPQFGVDQAKALEAAELSRCDLLSQMVGEFPELQGEMGRTYLQRQGGDADVAIALDEFYQPRGAGQAIAGTALGQLLAVAERLDTLAGIYALGQRPTGNKDPFSLRRVALGLARTLIEGGHALDLPEALGRAVDAARAQLDGNRGPKDPATADAAVLVADLLAFIYDRLRAYYADIGVDGRVFEAVAALDVADLTRFDARVKACQAFMQLPQWESLAAANKRIRNILRKAGAEEIGPVRAQSLVEPAEIALAAATTAAAADVAPLLAAERYVELLTRLAALQAPVDAFFDGVMVMAEDPQQRRNRLGLLKQLQDLFLQVADVSLLAAG
jgi:glycyl-tRNA synthetase beta chain